MVKICRDDDGKDDTILEWTDIWSSNQPRYYGIILFIAIETSHLSAKHEYDA